MNPTRRIARTAGIFFLVTEVTAIAAQVFLYTPVLKHADYVLGAGADTRVALGALCEMILVAAIIGTAVTLYPMIKRQSEGIALGYACARLLEATVIVIGAISVLSVLTLRQDGGADAGALAAAASSLVAVHDWTFLVGPSLILGVNSALLAFLMYRSALVPRPIAVLGLVGGPLVCASGIAVLLGAYGQSVHTVAALPVFAWEISLAVRLIVKGFDSSPLLVDDAGRLDVAPVLIPA